MVYLVLPSAQTLQILYPHPCVSFTLKRLTPSVCDLEDQNKRVGYMPRAVSDFSILTGYL